MMMSISNLFTGFAALLVPALALASSESMTIARYPHGNFLENMSVRNGRDLLYTSYVDRRIWRWTGSGEPRLFASLDVHPVAVLARRHDVIVSAHGESFLDGPDFLKTQKILVLGSKGTIVRQIAIADARFLNGLVALEPDTILAADSALGRIWQLAPSTGKFAPWLSDQLLGQDPENLSQRPTVNGLKLHNGWLYFSNSARGALYRLKIQNAQPNGAIEEFAKTGPIDDFTFLPDGSIAAATHGAKLLLIKPDGSVSDLMQSGCDGCTAVAVFGGRLIVTTTGNLLEGGGEPARLISISLPTKK
jgi:sugar lactone lactonase YvrE